MFDKQTIQADNKQDFYRPLNEYFTALISEDSDWLAGLSNASALLYQLMPHINWAGFYLLKNGELILGPFQGKPACVRIPLGRGVCGTAALKREIQLVEDVDYFPGHITCDPASRSEIVVPIIHQEKLMGVLDIDSPVKARFDEDDAVGLQGFVDILNRYIDWPEHF